MLEAIEWTRVWREEVNEGKPRVLLIGDSIIDGSKSQIGEVLGAKASISAFITSKALDNPWYAKELDLLLEQEGAYAAVYLNNGLHTGGQSPETYAANYRSLVLHLQTVLPDTPILLGLSTPVAVPVTDPGSADAPITPYVRHTEADLLVKAYNRAVTAIASEFGLPCLDMYTRMDGAAPHLRRPDGYHFTEEGSRFFAESVAEAVSALF